MDLVNQIIQQTTAVGATALPVSFPLSGNFENRPTGLSQSNVDCWNHFGSVCAQLSQGFFYFSSDTTVFLIPLTHRIFPHCIIIAIHLWILYCYFASLTRLAILESCPVSHQSPGTCPSKSLTGRQNYNSEWWDEYLKGFESMRSMVENKVLRRRR